jgi:hypothetical protein
MLVSEAMPFQISIANRSGITIPMPCKVISQRRLSTRSATHPPINRNNNSGNCPTICVTPKLPGD